MLGITAAIQEKQKTNKDKPGQPRLSGNGKWAVLRDQRGKRQ